jgi:hypothetical protein
MRLAASLVGLVLVVGCDGGDAAKPAKPAPTVSAKPQPATPKADEAKVEPLQAQAHDATPASDAPSEVGDETLTTAEPGNAYGQVLIQTRSEAEGGHVAELTIVRDDGAKAHTGTVRYTAEPYVLVAEAKAKLEEANLLGSGIAFDLDGDGKTTSAIASRCDGDAAVLALQPSRRLEPVTVLTEAVARFDYGKDGSRLLSNDASGGVLYAPCGDTLIFGLDPKGPQSFHTVASPSVFAVYRVQVDSLDAPDPLSLKALRSGDSPLPHQVHPFREVSVQGGEVKVYAAQLVVFALHPTEPLQHISLQLEGPAPEFVTASINEVDAEGHRIRYADGFKPFPKAP